MKDAGLGVNCLILKSKDHITGIGDRIALSVIPFHPFDKFIHTTYTFSGCDLDTDETTIAVPYTPRVLYLPIVRMAASVLEMSCILYFVTCVPPFCYIAI